MMRCDHCHASFASGAVDTSTGRYCSVEHAAHLAIARLELLLKAYRSRFGSLCASIGAVHAEAGLNASALEEMDRAASNAKESRTE